MVRIPPIDPRVLARAEEAARRMQDAIALGFDPARATEEARRAHDLAAASMPAAAEAAQAAQELADRALPRATTEPAQRTQELAKLVKPADVALVPGDMARIEGVADQAVQAGLGIINRIGDVIRDAQLRAAETVARIRSVFPDAARIGDAVRQADLFLRSLTPAVRAALATLGAHGWCPGDDMDSAEILGMAERFRSGPEDEAHDAMCAHFDTYLGEIVARVTAKHPRRAKIIESAAQAHREGKYELSVPPLLAQVDGICQEEFGYSFFAQDKKTKQPMIANKLMARLDNNDAGDLARAFYHLLQVVMPVSYNIPQRQALAKPVFNRHAVLHGEDVEYGTHRNSCRAVSLLGYVVSMLGDLSRPVAASSP